MRAFSFGEDMRLVLIEFNKENTMYSVYDGRVSVAIFQLDKPDVFTPGELEDIRTATYDEKA